MLQLVGPMLTQLVPQQAALVSHNGALRPPEYQPGVGQKLLSHQGQHTRAVRVSRPKHLANLRTSETFLNPAYIKNHSKHHTYF